MNIIKIIIITLWLLCGLIANWRVYHGILKMWYYKFNESIWSYNSTVPIIIIMIAPIVMISGPFNIVITELIFDTNTWWFTTKNKIK